MHDCLFCRTSAHDTRYVPCLSLSLTHTHTHTHTHTQHLSLSDLIASQRRSGPGGRIDEIDQMAADARHYFPGAVDTARDLMVVQVPVRSGGGSDVGEAE
jgi:hypothetical protein